MEKQKNRLLNVLGFIFSTKNLEKRNFGIDFVKSIAALFVLSVHFFLNNGYYNIPMTELNIIIPTAFRWIFMLGVPLFLISTGYLKRETKFTALHYVKITPVIVTTVIIGIITVLYKINFLHEEFPPFVWIRSIWACEQPNYAWYVEMYLCLALIMPFISYAWNAIESQRKKQMMILVFAVLTSLPLQINRWPVMETNLGFTPDLWTPLYPVTYFLTGAYIREYSPKINKIVLSILFCTSIAYQAVKTYSTANGNTFYAGVNADFGDLITLITSTILFLLIYDIKVKNKPVRAIFASISSVTLGLYLLSWISDHELYPYHTSIGTFSNGVRSMPLAYLKIIPLNFAVCYIGATIVNIVTRLVTDPIIKFAAKKGTKHGKTETSETPEKETVKV